MRLINRRNALVFAALLALLWGYFYRVPELLALGSTFALLLLLSYMLVLLGQSRISARRELYPRAFEDQVIDVRIALENRFWFPFFLPRILDYFPASASPKKTVILFPLLRWRSRIRTGYGGDCFGKRGLYSIGPLTLELPDPLGLFRVKKAVDQYSSLLVYPCTFEIAQIPESGRGNRYNIGHSARPRAGNGLDFFGTREYRPGDSLRHIHWPSTARRGKLIIREFEETVASNVAIFLDLNRYSLKGLGRQSTLEYAVKIAASLASYYARSASQIQLFAYGKDFLHIPPASGEEHLAAILHALTFLKPNGEVPYEFLLRSGAEKLFPGSTAVFIFSTVKVDLSEYIDILTLYRAKGITVLAVLIDDDTFLRIFREQEIREREAPKIPDVVNALLAEGITVYTVACRDDLSRRFDLPFLPVSGRGIAASVYAKL
jgi:uncharacterized protein (DUF58 family)